MPQSKKSKSVAKPQTATDLRGVILNKRNVIEVEPVGQVKCVDCERVGDVFPEECVRTDDIE
jgi:hypothetical protein